MKKWLIALMMAAGAATCSAAEVKNDDGVNIYFARHGKTLLNTFDRVQGWADSPLTEDGIRVARYLGEGLKGIPFDSFYSSDAGRQRETMQVILKQAGVSDYKLTELSGLRKPSSAVLKAAITKIWPTPAPNSWGLKMALRCSAK